MGSRRGPRQPVLSLSVQERGQVDVARVAAPEPHPLVLHLREARETTGHEPLDREREDRLTWPDVALLPAAQLADPLREIGHFIGLQGHLTCKKMHPPVTLQ